MQIFIYTLCFLFSFMTLIAIGQKIHNIETHFSSFHISAISISIMLLQYKIISYFPNNLFVHHYLEYILLRSGRLLFKWNKLQQNGSYFLFIYINILTFFQSLNQLNWKATNVSNTFSYIFQPSQCFDISW